MDLLGAGFPRTGPLLCDWRSGNRLSPVFAATGNTAVALTGGAPPSLSELVTWGSWAHTRGGGGDGMGTGGGPTRARPVAPQAQSVGGADRRLPPRAGRGAAQTTTDPVWDRGVVKFPHTTPMPMPTCPHDSVTFMVLTAGAGGPTQRSRWSVCTPPRAGAATAGPTTCHGVGDTRAAVPGPRHDARGQGRATEPKDQVCRS